MSIRETAFLPAGAATISAGRQFQDRESRMNTDEKVERLARFKKNLVEHRGTHDAQLREQLNQEKPWALRHRSCMGSNRPFPADTAS